MRTTSLSAVAAALMIVASLAPVAAAESSFVEDWENGMDGWTVTGDAPSIECGSGDCVLRLDPPAYGRTEVARSFSAPTTDRVLVEFSFFEDEIRSDTDINLLVHTDRGVVVYHVTEFVSVNNGLSLITDLVEHRGFGFFTPAEWTTLRILVDPQLHLAQAQMRLPNGILLPSLILPFDLQARHVTGVSITAQSWTQRTSGFSVDDVSAGPTTECFAPVGNLHLDVAAIVNEVTQIGLEIDSPCDAADWVLELADGTRFAGTDLEATLEHVFEEVGEHALDLNLVGPDGQRVQSRWTIDVVEPGEPPVEEPPAPVERTQFVAGELGLGLGGADVLGEDLVALEAPAQGGEPVTLTWEAHGVLMGLRFVDAQGTAVGSCVASLGETGVACDAPAGATGAVVTGHGADVDWILRYTYVA